MMLCFAMFSVAAWISLWLDRPEREHRSIAERSCRSPARYSPPPRCCCPPGRSRVTPRRPRRVGSRDDLDWLHLITGSLWLGGLVGLLVLWFSLQASRRVAGLSVVVPRFSNVAFVSVFLLLGTGTWATINHMPTLNALWLTGYGVAILVKVGLLLCAMALGAGNLLRTKPRLSRPAIGLSSVSPPRGCCAG